MTIIAYKDGVIAYDSRVTIGSLIDDDDAEKMVVSRGHRFFFAGNLSDQARFLDAFFEPGTKLPDSCVGAFVLTPDDVLLVAGVDSDTDVVSSYPVRKDAHHAMGSGRDFALAAMDLGMTAAIGVKSAISRDTRCGGKIRTCKIK